jgi:hypothetical protein
MRGSSSSGKQVRSVHGNKCSCSASGGSRSGMGEFLCVTRGGGTQQYTAAERCPKTGLYIHSALRTQGVRSGNRYDCRQPAPPAPAAPPGTGRATSRATGRATGRATACGRKRCLKTSLNVRGGSGGETYESPTQSSPDS